MSIFRFSAVFFSGVAIDWTGRKSAEWVRIFSKTFLFTVSIICGKPIFECFSIECFDECFQISFVLICFATAKTFKISEKRIVQPYVSSMIRHFTFNHNAIFYLFLFFFSLIFQLVDQISIEIVFINRISIQYIQLIIACELLQRPVIWQRKNFNISI